MNESRVVELLENAEYRFAKTAKNRNPHWYTLKDKWDSVRDFNKVVKYIRDNGEEESFWKVKYMCFHYKGWKWWTMGSPINETILINKTYASERYNKIAYKYDTLFKSNVFKKENQEIVEMLQPHLYKTGIVDIGSGTGLLLDLFTIDTSLYVGIDPSYGMVKHARLKHPLHKFKLDKLETYVGYDPIAVSLFGCMNYVIPKYIEKVKDISIKHFLMFYKPTYNPITYDIANVKMYPFKHTKKKLQQMFKGSKITSWNNYYIISNLEK